MNPKTNSAGLLAQLQAYNNAMVTYSDHRDRGGHIPEEVDDDLQFAEWTVEAMSGTCCMNCFTTRTGSIFSRYTLTHRGTGLLNWEQKLPTAALDAVVEAYQQVVN